MAILILREFPRNPFENSPDFECTIIDELSKVKNQKSPRIDRF